MKRLALIIGAMKAGTTSLYRYLIQHPEIASCKEKEPRFFVDDEAWSRGFDWYQDLWGFKPGTHKWALEASPEYSKAPYMPGVPERMAAFQEASGIELRFLYILRDPVERIVSHYRHNLLRQGQLEKGEIPGEGDVAGKHLWASMYATQIDRYMEHFDWEQVHLLTLEALSEDPDGALKEVCSFLGIDSDHRFEGLGQAHNTASDTAVPPRLLRRLVGTPLAGIVPGPIRCWVKRPPTANEQAINLSLESRAFLTRALEGDLRRLRAVYGLDTSLWNVEDDETAQESKDLAPADEPP